MTHYSTLKLAAIWTATATLTLLAVIPLVALVDALATWAGY